MFFFKDLCSLIITINDCVTMMSFPYVNGLLTLTAPKSQVKRSSDSLGGEKLFYFEAVIKHVQYHNKM